MRIPCSKTEPFAHRIQVTNLFVEAEDVTE